MVKQQEKQRGSGATAGRRRDSGKATTGRRRGRDDGLPPSFFTRYPPARLTRGKVRFLAFADRIRVCAIY